MRESMHFFKIKTGKKIKESVISREQLQHIQANQDLFARFSSVNTN